MSYRRRLERLERLAGGGQGRPSPWHPMRFAIVPATLTWPEERDKLAAVLAEEGPQVLAWGRRPPRRGTRCRWCEAAVRDFAEAEAVLGGYSGEVDLRGLGEEPPEWGKVQERRGLVIDLGAR